MRPLTLATLLALAYLTARAFAADGFFHPRPILKAVALEPPLMVPGELALEPQFECETRIRWTPGQGLGAFSPMLTFSGGPACQQTRVIATDAAARAVRCSHLPFPSSADCAAP
jgi:hypothetical protein